MMEDFLAFRRMITPVIIQVLFWMGVVASVVAGVASIANRQPVLGLLLIIVGPLVVRVYAELLILLFRINETLTDIKNNTERRTE